VYHRKWIYRKGFIGEEIPLTIEIENKKPLPLLWLQTLDLWPRVIAPTEEGTMVISHKPDVGYLTHWINLRWFARNTHSYQLPLKARGYFQVGPALARSSDLFSLSESEKTIAPAEEIVVYPSISHQPDLGYKTINPLGDQRAKRRLLEDINLPYGIRDYRAGDEFKRIHWNATARTGQLQSRLYQPVTSKVLMICLNVSTSEMVFGGYYPDLLEHLIQLAASMIYRSFQDGYAVGLLTNGGMVGGGKPFHIAPARSTHHLIKLLEALAGLQALTISKFENFLLHEMHSVPYGAALVILTSIVPESQRMILARLQKSHHEITLIYTGSGALPEIQGIRMIHSPRKNPMEGEG
jgi:uncharacterized protein (DUF58 family)